MRPCGNESLMFVPVQYFLCCNICATIATFWYVSIHANKSVVSTCTYSEYYLQLLYQGRQRHEPSLRYQCYRTNFDTDIISYRCRTGTYALSIVDVHNVISALEYSHPCTRCCCGNLRKMRLDVLPAAAVEDASGDAKFNMKAIMGEAKKCCSFGGAAADQPVAFTLDRYALFANYGVLSFEFFIFFVIEIL